MKNPDAIIREFIRLANEKGLTTEENPIYTPDMMWLLNDAKKYLGEE